MLLEEKKKGVQLLLTEKERCSRRCQTKNGKRGKQMKTDKSEQLREKEKLKKNKVRRHKGGRKEWVKT